MLAVTYRDTVTSYARRDPSAQAAQAASAGRLWQGRRRAAEQGAGGSRSLQRVRPHRAKARTWQFLESFKRVRF